MKKNARTKKTTRKSTQVSEMRDEYDFSHGVRAKYAARLGGRVRAVVLDADVAAAYPESRSLNKALRAALKAKQVAAKARTKS